ncbi:MAG: adenylate/guanylate cyclase domain-containing protein [Saprospiraceae bacterium]|nr:adenylate/guanylate cyclase domain-containing protein [Saprospiraceae bacterium]
MRFFFYCCILWLFVFAVPAEAQVLRQPSAQIENISGIPFIEVTMDLANKAFIKGDYLEAAGKAKEAAIMARQIGEKEWQAQALNLEAKASMEGGGRKLQTAKLLRESIQLTNDPDLKLENLNLLRTISIDLRRTGELQEIANEIAAITGNPQIDISTGRKSTKKILQDVAQENVALTDELASLEMEQVALMRALGAQESAIEKMNEEQAKVQLLLAQQKILLDSLEYVKMVDSLQLVQQEMRLSEQEMNLMERDAKLRIQRSRLYVLLSLALLFLIGVFALYNRSVNIKRHADQLAVKNEVIASEKARSELLLLNILPAAIATELKEKGVASARMYDLATVLFTDFRDFTRIADGMDPVDLVADLDYCFREFDKIVEKHGLEKIKTIGDSYMCAGGIPETSPDHPSKVAQAALDMQTFLEKWKASRKTEGKGCFEARIGIHSGPLVAGVVGSRKFAYDIWGSTVNLASRMESSGEVGKVNISEATYQLISKDFDCTFRGKIEAKNAGEVGMYFIS